MPQNNEFVTWTWFVFIWCCESNQLRRQSSAFVCKHSLVAKRHNRVFFPSYNVMFAIFQVSKRKKKLRGDKVHPISFILLSHFKMSYCNYEVWDEMGGGMLLLGGINISESCKSKQKEIAFLFASITTHKSVHWWCTCFVYFWRSVGL